MNKNDNNSMDDILESINLSMKSGEALYDNMLFGENISIERDDLIQILDNGLSKNLNDLIDRSFKEDLTDEKKALLDLSLSKSKPYDEQARITNAQKESLIKCINTLVEYVGK